MNNGIPGHARLDSPFKEYGLNVLMVLILIMFREAIQRNIYAQQMILAL